MSLGNEYLAAVRAVATLGKTAFGTGGCNRSIGNGVVTCGGNNRLLNEYLLTANAYLACGKTVLGTAYLLGGQGFYLKVTAFNVTNKVAIIAGGVIFVCLIMTYSGNLALCYEYPSAYRAMLSCGKAVFGAGGGNLRVNNLGMSGCHSDLGALLLTTLGAGA